MTYKFFKNIFLVITTCLLLAVILFVFFQFKHNYYLNFSDSAKFADVARNFYEGRGVVSSFSFYYPRVFKDFKHLEFINSGVLPVNIFSILLSFKLLGLNDYAVIAISCFYFFLTIVFVFLLSKKIFKTNLVSILSTLAVGFNYDLINYALKGASESPFIFEIVAAAYFITLKKNWATVISIIFFGLTYFTRPQAFIYIVGLMLYWLLLNFKVKKALISFGVALVIGFLFDYFVISSLAGKYLIYSVFNRGINAVSQSLPGVSSSNTLRGVSENLPSILILGKKLLYNIYNFYKSLPQIVNPYLFTLFIIGLFKLGKDRISNSFKAASLFMVVATFLVTAVSIPFFRYIHPTIPLVYIIAVGTLVEIINSQFTIYSEFSILNFRITKQRFIIFISSFLILFFAVGQTLGILLLDSRFEAKTHNVGKPPVYVSLSYILRDNTSKDDVVITNLDTWGSWYGERRTIWFPLEPNQLIDPATGKIPFDAIYLTSYLMEDQNYYMGGAWRQIFNNPNDPKKWTCDGCDEVAKEFKLKNIYSISSSDDYERQDSKAILLMRK